MTSETATRRKLPPRLLWAIAGVLFFICGMIIAPELVLGWFFIFAQLANYILFGWISFLSRVAPLIRFDPMAIAIGIGAVILLIAGVQTWISKSFPVRSWTATKTVLCTIGSLGIFLGSICVIALGHEISWNQRSRTSWIRVGNTWDSLWFRNRSKEDLKQIGLAAYLYSDVNIGFPTGGDFALDGTAGHGWMTALLPYIGETLLHSRIKTDVPWYHHSNHAAFETRVPVYESWNAKPPAPGEYANAFFAANDRLLNANRGRKPTEITDGTSNTIFAGDVKDNLRPWGDVINWRSLELGINKSRDGFGAPTTSFAHFLLCDGTVRMISENIDPKVLKALSTPDAKDTVGDF